MGLNKTLVNSTVKSGSAALTLPQRRYFHRQRVSASRVVPSRKVKHRKIVNLDPRQIQTIKVTVIKLGKIDKVDHMNKCSKFHRDRARGSAPVTT
jgi:hypothetical protein